MCIDYHSRRSLASVRLFVQGYTVAPLRPTTQAMPVTQDRSRATSVEAHEVERATPAPSAVDQKHRSRR